MQFASLINRVQTEPYKLIGQYTLSSPPFESIPLKANAEFVRDENALVIQGGWQKRAAAPLTAFELVIPFRTMTVYSAWATLTSPPIGKLEGRIVSTGEHFQFLACSREYTLCSANLRFTQSQDFGVTGMVTIGNHSVAFVIDAQGNGKHGNTAQILSLSGKRA